MVGGGWREVHWKCNVLSTVQLVEASKRKKQLTNRCEALISFNQASTLITYGVLCVECKVAPLIHIDSGHNTSKATVMEMATQ